MVSGPRLRPSPGPAHYPGLGPSLEEKVGFRSRGWLYSREKNRRPPEAQQWPWQERGVAEESTTSPAKREKGRGRALRAYACAHAAGGAELRGAGATAEEVSLFPLSGLSVAARVATGEVGRGLPCEAIETPFLSCLQASAPARLADPGDARSSCGPGPPAALQVGASGSPVPAARGGPGLDWCCRVTTRHRACPPSRATTALCWLWRPGGAGPRLRCAPAPGLEGGTPRCAPACRVPRRGWAGVLPGPGEVGPSSSWQVGGSPGLSLRDGVLDGERRPGSVPWP